MANVKAGRSLENHPGFVAKPPAPDGMRRGGLIIPGTAGARHHHTNERNRQCPLKLSLSLLAKSR
jgi:hypothetical protein